MRMRTSSIPIRTILSEELDHLVILENPCHVQWSQFFSVVIISEWNGTICSGTQKQLRRQKIVVTNRLMQQGKVKMEKEYYWYSGWGDVAFCCICAFAGLMAWVWISNGACQQMAWLWATGGLPVAGIHYLMLCRINPGRYVINTLVVPFRLLLALSAPLLALSAINSASHVVTKKEDKLENAVTAGFAAALAYFVLHAIRRRMKPR